MSKRNRSVGRVSIALALLVAACSYSRQHAYVADVVYHNGYVYTVDEANPRAQAFAVKDGKIVDVGSNDRIVPWDGFLTRAVDLEGRFVMPVVSATDPWNTLAETATQVGLEEAVRALTLEAALVKERGHAEGSIKIGKNASFVVLDRNPFEVPLDSIADTQVLRKVVDGRRVD